MAKFELSNSINFDDDPRKQEIALLMSNAVGRGLTRSQFKTILKNDQSLMTPKWIIRLLRERIPCNRQVTKMLHFYRKTLPQKQSVMT